MPLPHLLKYFCTTTYALLDHHNKVAKQIPIVTHSYIRSIRFEGGALNGQSLCFPHLNTLVGIRGSGKSSVLEIIRYALDIAFGVKALDTDYKDKLVEYGGLKTARFDKLRKLNAKLKEIFLVKLC